MINFINNLKYLRKINNMTQKDLAKLMNVSFKTINHWECGYSEPNLEQLKFLKTIFNISYDELLD